MAQSHHESRDFPLAEAQRLKAKGLNNYAIAQTLGWSEPTVRRKLQGRRTKTELSAPDEPPATNTPTNGDISLDTSPDSVLPTVPILKAKGEPGIPPGEPDDAIGLVPTVHQGLPDGAPKTDLNRLEYLGEPGAPGGLPTIAMQSEVDELKARVSVLEAFFATIQRHPAYVRGSPLQFTNGAPSGKPSVPVRTHKRGFVMADDVWEAIHIYAGAHHRQIAEVVDQALREFFAHQGWPGQEVRRDG